MSGSEVDICNLALGFLGDDATIASISPPEGSPQSEHCAQFYPLARDALLEMHDWRFATRRGNPALLSTTITEWLYAYQMPSDAIRVIAVLPEGSTDDINTSGYSQIPPDPFYSPSSTMPGVDGYAPQPFTVETLPDGTEVIYTNTPTPDLRYLAYITDTTKFSPLFTIGCAKLLSAFIAGPIYKGDVGQEMSDKMMAEFSKWEAKAAGLDANQSRTKPKHSVPWIANR